MRDAPILPSVPGAQRSRTPQAGSSPSPAAPRAAAAFHPYTERSTQCLPCWPHRESRTSQATFPSPAIPAKSHSGTGNPPFRFPHRACSSHLDTAARTAPQKHSHRGHRSTAWLPAAHAIAALPPAAAHKESQETPRLPLPVPPLAIAHPWSAPPAGCPLPAPRPSAFAIIPRPQEPQPTLKRVPR